MKADARKLKFDRSYEVWIEEALVEDPRVELLHLLPSISIDAALLSWKHGDPADRFIVATARHHAAVLVTADERILDSGLVKCVWD